MEWRIPLAFQRAVNRTPSRSLLRLCLKSRSGRGTEKKNFCSCRELNPSRRAASVIYLDRRIRSNLTIKMTLIVHGVCSGFVSFWNGTNSQSGSIEERLHFAWLRVCVCVCVQVFRFRSSSRHNTSADAVGCVTSAQHWPIVRQDR
jgi:hypothetical protein